SAGFRVVYGRRHFARRIAGIFTDSAQNRSQLVTQKRIPYFAKGVNFMVNHITAAIRDNKKNSILAPIFVGFEVLFEVLIPIVMAILIDKGIDAGNQTEILRYGAILIVMALAALVFGILSGIAAANA